ncbi:hypothetical protein TrLO_g1518 [Triparma laevis f. longispina]|uniref:Uncharacterized protein n=1 Tax=Triparma laevis f. longispina TaxID=1714387 RepID=A0A9W7ANL6_9STRA|nr:hypothetical protein TrLO_g1518 [Triparma laevis f. longispina]
MAFSIASKLPPIAANARIIFMVRHIEVIPPGGIQGVHYGDLDVDRSPLGKKEATAAGHFLFQYKLHSVWSSQLSRAVCGAEALDEILEGTPKGEATCVVSHLWVTRSMIRGAAQVVMKGFKPDVGLEKSKDTGN